MLRNAFDAGKSIARVSGGRGGGWALEITTFLGTKLHSVPLARAVLDRLGVPTPHQPHQLSQVRDILYTRWQR